MELTRLPERLGAAPLARLFAELHAVEGPIVLGGGPEVFCRGLDFAELLGSDERRVAGALSDFARVLLAIRRAPAPVVAVVEGEALGGGLGLAAAADVVIAAPGARFGLPEVLFGLSPAMILPALEERLGPQRARRLALSAATIGAEEALRLGLVDHVGAVEPILSRELRSLRRAQPDGVRQLKQHPSSLAAFEAGLSAGEAMTREALRSGAVRARLARFVEEGVAPWC